MWKDSKTRIRFAFKVTALLLICGFVQTTFAQNIKLSGGKWFDGQKFSERTVWISDGKLSFKPKRTTNETSIDIKGKYVIPPYAEAHNHNLESEFELKKRIDKYFLHGVFYVKLQSCIKKRIAPLMSNYNHPLGLDISLTYGPITGTGGHPIAIRKSFFEQGFFGDLFKTLEEIESHGYFIVDTEKDLSDKWESILSFKPDFIKVIVSYSEEYEKRKDDPAYFGRKGFNPKLLPDLIKRAHRNGLRVSVHVNTATDFHHAVMSGADEIAHLPGTSTDSKVIAEDARMAAKKNIVVVTTAGLVNRRSKDPNYNKYVEAIKYNLKALKDAGVKLAVGSDEYNDTSLDEATYLAETGIFSNLELLKMWSETAAETIFPKRRIGRLIDGYEASFLVLDGDPIQDWSNCQKISMRVKQGQILK